MKNYLYLGFAKQFVLIVTPILASSVLASSPSQAATLAFAQEELNFTNFSQSFGTIDRQNQANTNASTFTDDATVLTINQEVQTDFTFTPPEAYTQVGLSLASGEGTSYFGTADTFGGIVGNFDINAGESFSFDFTASLNLGTSIDDPPQENAKAIGDISFLLFDTSDIEPTNISNFVADVLSGNQTINKDPLDYFSLAGNINTAGDDDFLTYENSQNISLSNELDTSDFDGNEETASANISGSYQRSFENKTNLTLVAVRKSQVKVAVPEPSTYLGSILFFGLGAIALKAKRKLNRQK
ncbi:MAG: PEP-CTERM sorting domain-containing protein [Nostochopsis sp.]